VGWRRERGPATAFVQLLDVSLADAPAREVARQVIPDVALADAVMRGIPFTLRVPALDPRARYSFSALVDVDGDGQTSLGDYQTTESYPLLEPDAGGPLLLRARRIGRRGPAADAPQTRASQPRRPPT